LGSCSAAVCNPTLSTGTNRITSSGYTYDANGAVTQDASGQRFGYDAESRQKEFFAAANSGGRNYAIYSYDGEPSVRGGSDKDPWKLDEEAKTVFSVGYYRIGG